MENKSSDHLNGKREKDLLVEKVDIFLERYIYSSDIPDGVIVGAVIGTVILGILAWLVAAGIWPMPYFGQFSASGDGVAAVVGAGVGAAIGGMIGGIIALLKLKKRNV